MEHSYWTCPQDLIDEILLLVPYIQVENECEEKRLPSMNVFIYSYT